MFTEDKFEFRNFSTSSNERSILEALISRGSKLNVLAAHKAKVVFPIPGEPTKKTAPLKSDFRYCSNFNFISECPITSSKTSGLLVSEYILYLLILFFAV